MTSSLTMDESESVRRIWDVARPARHRRRPHPLHAEAGDGQGVAVLRRRRTAGRAAVADHLPHRRGRPARDAAAVRRAGLHVAGLPAQAADGGLAESVGRPVRRGQPRIACTPRRSTPSPTPPSTSRRRSTAAPGSSRPTSRSAATTRTIRCSTRCGARSRTPASPSSSTAGPGPQPGESHRTRAHPRAAAPPSATAPDRRPHGHARVPRVPRHLRAVRPRCGWTPRWCSPPFVEQTMPFPTAGLHAAARPRRSHPVRQRLPQHPVRLRDAMQALTSLRRRRRRLAARRLPRQRGPPVRADSQLVRSPHRGCSAGAARTVAR